VSLRLEFEKTKWGKKGQATVESDLGRFPKERGSAQKMEQGPGKDGAGTPFEEEAGAPGWKGMNGDIRLGSYVLDLMS